MNTFLFVLGQYSTGFLRIILWAAVLSFGLSGVSHAATAEQRCQKKKLAALGKRNLCLNLELSRAAVGGVPDPVKCADRFNKAMANADKAAAKKGTSCRWLELGDGTVRDLNTGLQWEMKTDDGSIHDKDNLYAWSSGSTGKPDGAAFVDFLGALNAGEAPTAGSITGCFAGECDWRLPTIDELAEIADTSAPGCGSGASCTTIPGDNPTVSSGDIAPLQYWSSTTNFGVPSVARVVGFDTGFPGGSALKIDPRAVRAVRGGL